MRRLVLRLHWRIETVARRFGVHHSTVRHALDSGPGSDAVAPGSILDPCKRAWRDGGPVEETAGSLIFGMKG